jgi:PKD repeat protein
VVTAPATQTVQESSLLTFTVSASDPDGDAIASLTAAPLPAGASFTPDGTNASGTFSWTPDNAQAGSHTVTFTASNALTGTAATVITVTNLNNTPVVTAPATQTVDEGVLLTFGVSASDADGDHVTLTALGIPVGATFLDNGDDTGTFSWTPSFTQAGSYTVTFNGSDGNGGTGSATTAITVNNVNRCPTANAGGPYTGVVNIAITFNGSGSSDPDGDALTYAWDFGDGGTATGNPASHTYAAVGSYTVTLTVDDGLCQATATTTASVVDVFQAMAFQTGGNATLRLGSGKSSWCTQIEPIGGSFDINSVVLSSIKMINYGMFPAGTVMEIASFGKTVTDGDKDRNGIMEITACFEKTALRNLFSAIPAGTGSYQVRFEGTLVTGGRFRADATITVNAKGGALAASITPNPFNPEAVISFATSKPGAVKVDMFDVQGRLVRTLADESNAAAGSHDVRISGNGLASGMYLVKISTVDGVVTQKALIAK